MPEKLKELCRANHIPLTHAQLEKFQLYSSLLKKWASRLNLVSASDLKRLEERHFFDSLLAIKAFEAYGFEPSGKVICDIGSGAGFPGVPLAIVLNQSRFYLVESRRKRCVFLEEVLRRLSLSTACVLCTRVQDVSCTCNMLTARAVAPPAKVLQMTLHLLRKGATLCLYAGKQPLHLNHCPGCRLKSLAVKPKGVNFARHFLFVKLHGV